MDTYQLNEQQQRLAETFYYDYSLIKFGAYGEEYLYTVCDVDAWKYYDLKGAQIIDSLLPIKTNTIARC